MLDRHQITEYLIKSWEVYSVHKSFDEQNILMKKIKQISSGI